MNTLIGHQTFLLGHVEERSVSDTGLVSTGTGVGWPGIQVGIEVDD